MLDDNPEYRKAQTAILERVRVVVASVGEFVSKGRNIVLYGPVGTGKDRLLAALLYAATRVGKKCAWTYAAKFFADVSDRFTAELTEEAILTPLSRCDVLGISDPVPPVSDAARPTDLQKLVNLLERRARVRRSTWVTLNALSPEDAEAKLSAQVWDRLQYRAEILHCCWPSFREAPHA